MPAAVLAAVGLGAVVPTLSGASAPPNLPAQTAQQLVADHGDGQDAPAERCPDLDVQPGPVRFVIPRRGSPARVLATVSTPSPSCPVTTTSTLWLGTKAEHVALIEPSDQEVDVVRNGNQVWLWDSSTQTVVHLDRAPQSPAAVLGARHGRVTGVSARGQWAERSHCPALTGLAV